MEYFYTPVRNISTESLLIEDEEFSHLTHVMRKRIGDEVMVVDGVGTAYQTLIEEINKRSARCIIQKQLPRLHELSVDITLSVGIVKNPSRFDFLVEKATELGVNRIVPLLTERVIPHHAKTERWQKIALAAMKQSGRCVLPVIESLTRFDDFIESTNAALKILPHEKANSILSIPSAGSIAICIGPEGGFTDKEVSSAEGNGFLQMSLGERRLRTETAAVAAICRALF
jgi:16S rRNA (uracil1498-N3)-methyltransferase